MILYLNNEHPRKKISRIYFEKKIPLIFSHLALVTHTAGVQFSVTFVSDSAIRRLNKQFRKKNKPTDVLSFPMEDPALLGDVVISLDTASRQARQKNISQRAQCMVLIIHGLLHLLGYDHVRDKDYRVMQEKEKELLKLV